MRGRTIRTDESTAAIVAKLSAGLSVSAACKAAKIGRSSYYEWLDEDAEFAAIVADAIEAGTDKLEDSTTRQALQGNTTLMVLLLKARRKDKYTERSETAITGKDGAPLKVVIERVTS
jgi:hypothetical protein